MGWRYGAVCSGTRARSPVACLRVCSHVRGLNTSASYGPPLQRAKQELHKRQGPPRVKRFMQETTLTTLVEHPLHQGSVTMAMLYLTAYVFMLKGAVGAAPRRHRVTRRGRWADTRWSALLPSTRRQRERAGTASRQAEEQTARLRVRLLLEPGSGRDRMCRRGMHGRVLMMMRKLLSHVRHMRLNEPNGFSHLFGT